MILADARAFTAAALKEWRQIRRYPFAFVGGLIWPVVLPAFFVAQGVAFSGGDARALASFRELAGTTSVAGFVFIGWAMYMWLSRFLWGPGTSLRNEQLRGSLEAVFLTPASRFVLLFGPPAAHFALAVFDIVVMLVWLRLAFDVPLGADATARAFVVVALTLPAMYGIATLFATLVVRAGEVNTLVQAARAFFTLTSGVTYPIVLLPEWARAVALALPPTYFVADVRAVLLAGAELVDLVPELALLVVLGIATCGLAALAYRFAERAARRTGALGAY